MIIEKYMKSIRVFEYSTLLVGDHSFLEEHFKMLVKYNEKHGNKFFNVGNNKIYFKNYVGALQVGNLIIEILPKVDRCSSIENDHDKWHRALIHMLHLCGSIKLDTISRAQLDTQNITLIDIFYRSFVDEVKEVIHSGLVRRYRQYTSNKPYLKGRLEFNKHISKNHLHKELFYTTSQLYDHNNIYNQLLLLALNHLKNVSKDSWLYSEICNLLFHFNEIEPIKYRGELFDSLSYDRSTSKYEKSLFLAHMILENYSPDLNLGTNSIVSILFDMNVVFEKVVYRLLKQNEESFKNNSLSLTAQKRKDFWQGHQIKPDIFGEYLCHEKNDYKRFIIDTKWKIPINSQPSDQDLKQVYTYNLHFGANQSVLLYPYTEQNNGIHGSFDESCGVKESFGEHACLIRFIDIFNDDGSINRLAGVELMKELIK